MFQLPRYHLATILNERVGFACLCLLSSFLFNHSMHVWDMFSKGILHSSFFSFFSQAGKTLSARRWHAAFSEDGHLDIEKVLRRIQRGVSTSSHNVVVLQ